MVGVSLRLAILILPGTGTVELKHGHVWQAGILTGFRIMSGGDAEDGEYCCGVDCRLEDAVRLLITLGQDSNGTHWSTRVHGHHCAVARRFGQSFLQLRRYMFTTCCRECEGRELPLLGSQHCAWQAWNGAGRGRRCSLLEGGKKASMIARGGR